ncbi:LA_2272 family surface repeat-containing protein [Pendulispora albinea]|uniref:Uncharacterized protein n=1 Tax=Pendulispora albinea TaxID=2741071 RepID=A0ABZ2LYX1_9BACT
MSFARALLLALLLISFSTPVFAAPPSGNDAPIALQVQGDEAPERVRAALSEKVRTTLVAPGAASDPHRPELVVRIKDTLVTINYRDGKGRDVERTVQAANKAAVLDTASLLAENLVTNQTDALLTLTAPPPAAAQDAQNAEGAQKEGAKPAMDRPFHPLVVSLVYPIATNFGRPDVRTPFAMDALYGRIGELDGLQMSGILGQVDGSVNGLQMGGIAAYGGEELRGVQMGGIGAYAGKGGVGGAQMGGIGTYSGEDVSGAQLAGIFAYTKRKLYGAQLAGITAIAPDGVEGMQMAPVNIAGDVRGTQFGVVNIGGQVKGLQFGVVNIADDVDGAQVGIFNYSRTGRIGAIAWSSNHGLANVGIKYATKYTYAVVRGTYAHERGTDFMGPGVNLGLHLPVLQPVYFDIDLGSANMYRISEKKTENFNDYQARLIAGIELANHLGLFAGGGLDVQVDNKGDNDVRFRPVFSGGAQLMY